MKFYLRSKKSKPPVLALSLRASLLGAQPDYGGLLMKKVAWNEEKVKTEALLE